jgi:hypothetical protein
MAPLHACRLSNLVASVPVALWGVASARGHWIQLESAPEWTRKSHTCHPCPSTKQLARHPLAFNSGLPKTFRDVVPARIESVDNGFILSPACSGLFVGGVVLFGARGACQADTPALDNFIAKWQNCMIAGFETDQLVLLLNSGTSVVPGGTEFNRKAIRNGQKTRICANVHL